jgi:hypothetical protein
MSPLWIFIWQLGTGHWQLFFSCAPAVQIQADQWYRLSGATSVFAQTPHRPRQLRVRFNLFFIPLVSAPVRSKKYCGCTILAY